MLWNPYYIKELFEPLLCSTSLLHINITEIQSSPFSHYSSKSNYPLSSSTKTKHNRNETPCCFPYLPPPYHQVSASYHQPEIVLDFSVSRLMFLSALPLNPQPLPPGIERVGQVSEREALNPQPLPPGIDRVSESHAA
jgi:hypothetical protein